MLAQKGTGLSAPASRQDVVSALLSAYGSSFDHGDVSPTSFSPVRANKELPPPPRVDSLQQKPLPAVQRAEQRMSTKFQLRADEEAARSPDSPTPRRKIMYRSLSREGKPPSLTLKVSNGSTAIVPPTPAMTIPSQRSPVKSRTEEKNLPSPPPPPPAKSERRSNAQTGGQQSKPQTPLARNDSLLSQGEPEQRQEESLPQNDMASVVKRKALPLPAVRKFRSLAELGTGPRGGKGGPMPPTSAPRKNSADGKIEPMSQNKLDASENEAAVEKSVDQQRDPLTINRLPPTPEDEKFSAVSVPVPPRKPVAAMGLPSNPRARGGPISPKHVKGKSSTNFNVLKAQRPAPPPPISKLETITPEMTPSPELKPNSEMKMDIISPVSPLPPPKELPRPFSFEAIKLPAPPVQEPEPEPGSETSKSPNLAQVTVTSPAPSPAAQQTLTLPQRPTSLDLLTPSPAMAPVSGTQSAKSPTPTSPQQTALPITQPAATITTPHQTPLVISQILNQPSPTSTSPTIPIAPPFTPLTRQPIPLPTALIPAILPNQLRCYTKHSTSIWSNNTFQPMGCMICRANDKDRKWTCTWCRLRICRACSEELNMVPGRDLGKLLEVREEQGKGNGGSNPSDKMMAEGVVVRVDEGGY